MMPRPQDLTDLPDAPVRPADLLSDVLGGIRLTGEHVERIMMAAGGVLPADRLIGACLFVVAAGGATLRIAGETLPIGTGDLVLLPEGAAGGDLKADAAGVDLFLARFRFDTRSLRGMVLVLPRLVHVSRAQGEPWLDGIARFLRIEAEDDQPGAALMVSRLIDLIVIRALRSWAQAGRSPGWLGGLADPRVAGALARLHADPLRRWTLDELAREAGMSRSSFADRFVALVGRPPLRYHGELRLGLARDLIVEQGLRVGEAGLQVGYESEAAFSRAYKAMFGHSPAVDRPIPARQVVPPPSSVTSEPVVSVTVRGAIESGNGALREV